MQIRRGEGQVHGNWGAGAQGYEIGGMRDRTLGSVAISLFGIFANARIMGGGR